jgi:pimeloyl-ACP methyl ester carboxylesterase
MERFSVAAQFTDPLRLPPRLTWLAGARDAKFAGLQSAMREAGFPGTFLLVGEAGHRLLGEAPAAVAAALDDLVA